MNRTTKTRPTLLAAAALAASLLAGAQAWSQPIEVYPTGNPTVDAVAIQNAVDGASAGDTIVLKAVNNNGDFTPFNLHSTILAGRGTIKINKALTITGEPYSSAISDRTVINGGFATFFVDTWIRQLAVDGPVNFEMLESRGAVYAFLNYKACNGASIADLTILDVLPAFPSTIYPDGFAYGISAENYRSDRFPPLYSPDKIRGDFHISRCRIEFPNTRADRATPAGILFVVCEANVTVSECQVHNMDVGIECVSSTGFTTIQNCDLVTNRIALGNGISRLSKGIAANVISGPVDILNNRVFIDGTGYDDVPVEILGVSVLYDTGPVTVENNCIIASTNKKGLAGYRGRHFFIEGNVTCSAQPTLRDHFTRVFRICSNNTFEDNDLTGLTTTSFGVDCGGEANVFERNIFGPHTGTNEVIACIGKDNTFSYNDFGMTGARGFSCSSSHVNFNGCILLDRGTSGNVVNALVSDFGQDLGPQYDPCTQVVDLTDGDNTVNLELSPGVPASCDSNQYRNLIHMLNQNREYLHAKAEIEAKLAENMKLIREYGI